MAALARCLAGSRHGPQISPVSRKHLKATLRNEMNKLLAVFVVAMASSAVTSVRAQDVYPPQFQSAFDAVVAWDPEFGELAPASPPGPGHDFAVGSQKVTLPNGDFQHVRVSAHSGPAGEDPNGSVRVSYSTPSVPGAFPGDEGDVKGDVVCLKVTGIEARIAALLREPFMGFSYVTLIIYDIGNPGDAMQQSPDLAYIFFAATLPAICAIQGTSLFPLGESSGNFVVRDEP
jgi:hypothetical protein